MAERSLFKFASISLEFKDEYLPRLEMNQIYKYTENVT